jgi:calcineurin-like phosphoesterase family protein
MSGVIPVIGCPDWIVSDTHFGQFSILDLEDRRTWMQVANLAAMHEAMFAAWVATVRPHDVVLHLGDHITAPPSRRQAIADRLCGTIILVAGNHDVETAIPGVAATYPAVRFQTPDGRQVLAVHDPADAVGIATETDVIILHGHLHGHAPRRPLPKEIGHRCFDCSMDRLRCRGPVRVNDTLDRLPITNSR